MFKAIGSLFVYKSPKEGEGYKRFLRYLSSTLIPSISNLDSNLTIGFSKMIKRPI